MYDHIPPLSVCSRDDEHAPDTRPSSQCIASQQPQDSSNQPEPPGRKKRRLATLDSDSESESEAEGSLDSESGSESEAEGSKLLTGVLHSPVTNTVDLVVEGGDGHMGPPDSAGVENSDSDTMQRDVDGRDCDSFNMQIMTADY